MHITDMPRRRRSILVLADLIFDMVNLGVQGASVELYTQNGTNTGHPVVCSYTSICLLSVTADAEIGTGSTNDKTIHVYVDVQ